MIRTAAVLAMAAVIVLITADAPIVAFVAPGPPHFTTSQIDLRFGVTVEKRPTHRKLIIAALEDGVIVVRASEEDLAGSAAPRTRWILWHPLAPGYYILVIAVFDDTGQMVGQATHPISVTN